MGKKQVLFFVGEDVAAHLIMNRVVNDMNAKGEYEPVLFFAKNAASSAANLPQLREFSFFEKRLLNDTVYPFLNKNPSSSQPILTPQQIHDDHGFHVEYLADINDPAFVAKIAENENIACAFSIRCTQLFRKDLVEAIKKNAPLLNLHSGLLPDYRGVMTTMRRMFDIATGKADGQDYGCTLHKVDPFDRNAIDKGIDTGKILDVKSIQLNPTHSLFQAHVGLVEAASEALIGALDQIGHGYTLRGYPQNNEQSKYFTFPTPDELREWKEAGIVLVRPRDAVTTLVNAFSKAGTPSSKKLEDELRQAILVQYSQLCGCSVNGAEHLADGGCPNFASYYLGSNANLSMSDMIIANQPSEMPALARV